MKKKWNSDKRKGFLLGALAAALAAVVIGLAAFWLPAFIGSESPDSRLSQSKIGQIMYYINSKYMGEIDEAALSDSMFLGLVAGLDDPYSTYYTKEEYDEVLKNQSGEFEGVGIIISTAVSDGKLTVTGLIDDGPAERAGILPGDEISLINGEDYSGASSSDASAFIASLDGDITITVYRPDTGETLDFTMQKETLENVSAEGMMLTDDIGYIAVTSFTSVTGSQFKKALEELREEGAEKFIFDLRGNPGGLVSSVTEVLRAFMPAGLLFYTEDKNGNRDEISCSGDNQMSEPLVVLVNSSSASASEIFTGAVQDHGVGTIVGVTTFGKGIVQNVYTLSDGSVVKLTVQHYYTPDGNDIHQLGITPDVVIENTADEDLQLEKAVELLSE